jgi:HK97 family phage major capsid protein
MATSEELLQSLSAEVKGLGEGAEKKLREVESRMLFLEQRADASRFGGNGADDGDIGAKVIQSDQFKGLQNGARSTGKISVGNLKTALINAIGQNQPLVQSDRTAIIPGATRRLSVRDVLPSSPTSSNAIDVVKESSFTNNAAPQYSAGQYENVVKAESALAFSLTTLGVSTLAHWIPVSRQLLDDAPAIQGYVNNRLLYGLKKVEETELLTGSGIQGHLSGLVTNSTAFDTSYSAAATDNYLDVIRKASLQLQVADYNPDVVFINPIDYDTAIGTKTSSTNDYVWANPAVSPTGQIWGLTPVITNSMTAGQGLVLDSRAACMIFDRMAATVEISLDHSDYRIRNMAAIVVEERLALAIFNTAAILYFGFPFGS